MKRADIPNIGRDRTDGQNAQQKSGKRESRFQEKGEARLPYEVQQNADSRCIKKSELRRVPDLECRREWYVGGCLLINSAELHSERGLVYRVQPNPSLSSISGKPRIWRDSSRTRKTSASILDNASNARRREKYDKRVGSTRKLQRQQLSRLIPSSCPEAGNIIAGKRTERYDIAVEGKSFFRTAGPDMSAVDFTCLFSPRLASEALQLK
jgi:hypothetical protein